MVIDASSRIGRASALAFAGRLRRPHSARVKALNVYALMVGTMQLSRALSDRHLAADVLEGGAQNALAALGIEQQGWRSASGW